MKFKTLDAMMRKFEVANDACVPPGMYMIVRLDGRGFSKLLRELNGDNEPYGEDFRDHMVVAASEIMRSGIQALYGHVHGDEISILLHPSDNSFGRKLRKLNSVLASTASAALSLRLARLVCFDCRVSQIPNLPDVVNYFRWRAADAERNCLAGYCQWVLQCRGLSAKEIATETHGMGLAAQRRLLWQAQGIEFSDLPSWKRRGVALTWETYYRELVSHETGDLVQLQRRRLQVTLAIPEGKELHRLLQGLCGDDADIQFEESEQANASSRA